MAKGYYVYKITPTNEGVAIFSADKEDRRASWLNLQKIDDSGKPIFCGYTNKCSEREMANVLIDAGATSLRFE